MNPPSLGNLQEDEEKRGVFNLFPLLLKLPQSIKIGTDSQFCTFCRVTIAFLIVVIEHQREYDDKMMVHTVHTPYE